MSTIVEKKAFDSSHVEQVDYVKEGALEGDTDYSGAVTKTDPKEIALVKKLDYRIMPTLWAMYFLNYLDRNSIAQARLDNLEKDLHLKGNQYNTCISILFVGYDLTGVICSLTHALTYQTVTCSCKFPPT